jgi:hypothetical protein
MRSHALGIDGMIHPVVTGFGALVVESLCRLACTLRTAFPFITTGNNMTGFRASRSEFNAG